MFFVSCYATDLVYFLSVAMQLTVERALYFFVSFFEKDRVAGVAVSA